MKIQLSDHFTYGKLVRFVLPSIVMMIFTSIYSVVDGFFVSNYVGKTPFAAVNLIFPFLMIFGAFGFMIGTGGSALVAIALGEKNPVRANRVFSMLVYISIGAGILLTILGWIFLEPVAVLLGAKGALLEYCILYGRILLSTTTAFLLQNVFQTFLVVAEKPQLGLKITVAAGVTNMVLDWLFVAVLRWGLAGAGWATAISQIVGGVIPLIYFILPNRSLLQLTKTTMNWTDFWNTCTNGSSEMVTNLSMSLVGMLYNVQLMQYSGENGVAAYGVLMYLNFAFVAIFLGYSIGSAPIISYHYGAGNREELKNLFGKSVRLISGTSIVLTLAAELSAGWLSRIFVGYDPVLYDMTVRAFWIYNISYVFTGLNIFGSSFFTALGNGVVSACISFLRTFLFQVVAILLLPVIWGLDGIWLAVVAAELLALVITLLFFKGKRKKYGY